MKADIEAKMSLDQVARARLALQSLPKREVRKPTRLPRLSPWVRARIYIAKLIMRYPYIWASRLAEKISSIADMIDPIDERVMAAEALETLDQNVYLDRVRVI